jgi:hypothetical protein
MKILRMAMLTLWMTDQPFLQNKSHKRMTIIRGIFDENIVMNQLAQQVSGKRKTKAKKKQKQWTKSNEREPGGKHCVVNSFVFLREKKKN